jgi:hypothetical protein
MADFKDYARWIIGKAVIYGKLPTYGDLTRQLYKGISERKTVYIPKFSQSVVLTGADGDGGSPAISLQGHRRWLGRTIAKSFVVPALAGFKPQFPPKGGTTNDFATLLWLGKTMV